MPSYMRITKNGLPVINGEATAKGHERWIELSGVRMDAFDRLAGSIHSSAVSMSEIVVTKSEDSASTALFNQSLNGEAVTVQIDFVKPGEKSPYLTYTLQNTRIIDFARGTSSSDERITLKFKKMTSDTHDASPDVSRHSEVIMKGSTGNPGTRCIR